MYKEVKINIQKLIKKKKRDFDQEKLRENLGKPKEVWKALKSLGLPSSLSNFSQRWGKISFDEKTNNNSFKDFYANLAPNLTNFPMPLIKLV